MGDNNEKVLFGAEFEGDGITKGVDAVVENLEKMNQAQDKNKKIISDTNKEITANEKALAKLEKQQRSALNTESDYYKTLTRDIEVYRKKNEELTTSLEKSKTQFREQGVEINKQKKAINEATRDHEAFGKSISKFTNLNHLAAEGVGLVRRRVVDAGVAMVSGFAGGLVAAVLPALTEFIGGLFNVNQHLTELEKRQKVANEIGVKAVAGYIQQTTHLELIRAKLNDTNTSQADRVRLVDEYNKIADKGNQIDKTQINNFDLINEKMTAQIELIKQRALARAAESIIAEKAEALLKAQFAAKEKGFNVFSAFFDPELALKEQTEKLKLDVSTKNLVDVFKKSEVLKDIIKGKEEFDRAVAVGIGLITTDSLTTKPGKDKADKKGPENVFEQMLADLKARLSAATEKAFQSEPIIQKKFADQLEKEFGAIDKLINAKTGRTLTPDQAAKLKDLLDQINLVDLSKSLEDFRKKKADALLKITAELDKLQHEQDIKRIQNIRDDFEREKAAIENGFQSTVDAIKKAQKDLFKKIDEDPLISDSNKAKKKTLASIIFKGLLDEAEVKRTNDNLDLSFKTFNKTVEDANVMFEKMQLANDQKTAAAIQKEKAAYADGTISYEKFQKRVTEILRLQKEERDRIRILELNTDRAVFQRRLEGTEDPEQKKALEKRIRDIDKEIAAINSQVDKNDPGKKRGEQFKAYVASLSSLLGTVVSFWNQVNQVEQAALDRSIALQNRRIENARLIAEKGNAEYLELEQKRLDELIRKREENARRQLAINNALTLSQALVAAITAIAQAASGGGGIAAIAAVAAVIGAIAAAYNFVASLQPQSAGFFKGKEFVDGPGGKDTIPARLTKGERVVTAEDNKKYWDTLSAIHNHHVPAEVLNSFVANYPDTHVPVVDFDRLMNATGNKTGFDSVEVAGKLDRLDETLNVVVASIQSLGINVKLDEEGFSASIESYSRKKKLRNRS